MAKNTGEGHRKGSVKDRTQGENPQNDTYTKRNRDPDSPDEGKFMDQKEDSEPFKGVAKEPDKRRSS